MYFGTGVSPCYRGHRIYDEADPATLDIVKKCVWWLWCLLQCWSTRACSGNGLNNGCCGAGVVLRSAWIVVVRVSA
jgi:hypothetical protein